MSHASKPELVPVTAPVWLTGLWRRSEILFPDGTADRTTNVLWGQTHTLFVDLRIPTTRPSARGRRSFDDFSLHELRNFADQKGFAGHIVVDGEVCSWVRYIDYRPNNGRPDQGRLRIDGETLYETGDSTSVLGSAYQETYHRERKADRRSVALCKVSQNVSATDGFDHCNAVLIVIDDRFLYARSRRMSLPPAETLSELITAAGEDRNQIYRYLDCEISYGAVDGDTGWQITASTIPFREGQRLMPRGFSAPRDMPGYLQQDDKDAWMVVESSLPTGDLLTLLNR